jgi:hypothetical protein
MYICASNIFYEIVPTKLLRNGTEKKEIFLKFSNDFLLLSKHFILDYSLHKNVAAFAKPFVRSFTCLQGCQIFNGATYQNGNNIPNDHKIHPWPQNIPNGSKIDQMAIKCSNIVHCKTFQNLPKFGFLV